MNAIKALTHPSLLYSRSAALSKPSPVPAERGLYSWHFRDIPTGVPIDDCLKSGDLTLLYVGISPKNETSKENLRKRITYHYRGNAEGSTLRQTLGVLLAEKSDYPLRRVGSGKRMTFTHLGECWLDEWMEENAFVCWVKHSAPWEVESEIISNLSLPLNLQDNRNHPFHQTLTAMRKEAKQNARELPIAQEGNQQRRM